MKTPIPYTNTIENLDERLLVKRGAGFPQLLFVLIPSIIITGWYLLMTGVEVFNFYANFSWSDLLRPYTYLTPLVIFVALATALKIYVTWSRKIPADFRVQRQSILPEALLASAITAALLIAIIPFAILTIRPFFHSLHSDLAPYIKAFFSFGITSLLIYELFREFEVLYHYATTYWRHVRVTATFDKATYRLGEQIKVQVRDRLSERSEVPHRVHLSHVEEKVVYTGGAKGTDSQIQRHATHNVYLDVTAAELHRGVTLTLPEPSPFAKRVTALRDKRPRYWEVLVEEHGGRFYARFLVNATR